MVISISRGPIRAIAVCIWLIVVVVVVKRKVADVEQHDVAKPVAVQQNAPSKGNKTIIGRVCKVTDGDTIYVVDDKGDKQKIRLCKIDAPEIAQSFGREARSYLGQRVAGKNVKVEYTGQDRYGRLLGTVFLNARDINLEMVRRGYAWHYAYHDSTAAYAQAEEEARTEKRGLWQEPNPVNPYLFRKSH